MSKPKPMPPAEPAEAAPPLGVEATLPEPLAEPVEAALPLGVEAAPAQNPVAEPALPALPLGVEATPPLGVEAALPLGAEVLAHTYDAASGILTVVLISGPKLRFAPGEVPAALSDLTIPF